jgi:hypothetical protein
MKKSNSLLSKAINEAETIRAGAMKNAHEILFNTFQPKIKNLFNEVLKEQVGVVNQDPMYGPDPTKYDQDKAEADLQNPENAMHQEGDGPELIEQEELENPDELPEQEDDEELVVTDLPEQDDEETNFEDLPEQDDEETNFEDLPEQDDEINFEDLPEQDDEVDDFELPEQNDEVDEQNDEVDDEDLPEQDDEEISFEDLPEQDDKVDDEDLPEQDDEVDDFELPEDIEVIDDEDLPEQTDVNPSLDQDVKRLANENVKFKSTIRNLRRQNQGLKEGIELLRKKIAEVSLFNAKVGAANKITSYKGLTEGQKIKMLEAFDKCKNIREVKLTYTNFKNFIKSLEEKKQVSESRRATKIQRTLSSKNVAKAKSGNVMSEEQRKTLKLAGILA